MNWKTTVAKLNARHYAFPAGWDTRETIADQLECSADRVDTLLAPGLKSGEIEKQQFPVWDQRLGRKVLVWGYRHRPAGAPAPAKKPSSPSALEALGPAVQSIALRHPHLRPSEIREYLPKRLRSSCRAADIVAILAE